MAITLMKTKQFIENNESGTTVVSQAAPKAGESMPIIVPKIMPYMQRGDKTGTTVTNGNMMFLNDASCKPNAPNIIKTQNFITPVMDSGSWGSKEDPETHIVKAGTQVIVTFPSGNTSNSRFRP